MRVKTEQVLFSLQNRLAMCRVNDTIEGAQSLIQNLSSSSSSRPASAMSIQEDLLSRRNLSSHLLLLDGAVDRCTSENLLRLREEGRFAGVAVATDESPPSQPRFRGLRFQITVFYWGTFKDLSAWETSADPPILANTCLADIMQRGCQSHH